MTNITLSIDDKIYSQMKKFSEIKWSEFVRKMIEHRIKELEMIEKNPNEGFLTMLASEKTLKKDWNNKLDERWNDV